MSHLLAFSASAGSGKTYTITRKFLELLLRRPAAKVYRNILAVTFTNKATAEMKERIMHDLAEVANGSYREAHELAAAIGVGEVELKQRAAKVQTHILHDYSRFSVLTIDKFFQKILRSFVREANLSPEYSVELDSDRLLAEGVDAMLENLHDDALRRQWLLDFVLERIDSGKAWNVKNDLNALGQEIFKERFVSLYTAMGEQLHNKAFMKEYLRTMKKIIDDVDAEMLRIARKAHDYMDCNALTADDFKGKTRYSCVTHFKKIAGKHYEPTATARKAVGCVKNWLGKDSSASTAAYDALNPLLDEALTLWDEKKIDYNSAHAICKTLMQLGLLADIMQHVQAIEKDNQILTISETTKHINSLIGSSDTPFIYEKIGNRYEHYLLDEFQDTSAMQWSNFKPLVKESLDRNADALCMVVGDVKQSIYRWRNGDWEILKRLRERTEQGFENTDPQQLATNWRSLPQVVHFNNELFHLLENDAATRSIIAPEFTDGAQQVCPPKANVGGGYVRVEFLPDVKGAKEDMQKTAVGQLLTQLEKVVAKGYRQRDIAVLLRKNSEAQLVAKSLLEAGYSVVSQDALLVSAAPVVRQITAMMRLASGRPSSISEHILTSELGVDDIADCKKFLSTLARQALPDAVESIIGKYRLNEKSDNIPYLQAFQDLVLDFAVRRISDIGAFVEWWAQSGCRSRLACPEGQDAITVTTIHKSKGLEFRVVLVPFADWSLAPRSDGIAWFATGNAEPFCTLPEVPMRLGKLDDTIFAAQYDDEKAHALVDGLNELYVAFTRAEEQLYIFASQKMPAKDGAVKSVNVALWRIFGALPTVDNAPKFGTLDVLQSECSCGLDTPSVVFDFGEMHAPKSANDKKRKELLSVTGYPSHICGNLRCAKREAWSDNVTKPIERGRKMHKIFEHIATVADVAQAVERCIDEGLASPDERAQLCAEVSSYLAQPAVAQWFDGSYTLLREAEIVLHSARHNADEHIVVRPDRVMLQGRSATVLDYKFGATHDNQSAHLRQVRRYTEALRSMGYEAKGLVWYVEEKVIVSSD